MNEKDKPEPGEVTKFRIDEVVELKGFHFRIIKIWANGRMQLKHIHAP